MGQLNNKNFWRRELNNYGHGNKFFLALFGHETFYVCFIQAMEMKKLPNIVGGSGSGSQWDPDPEQEKE
jgi:hypothetical protein